jgi:membrane-associated phospholipid phosphatase
LLQHQFSLFKKLAAQLFFRTRHGILFPLMASIVILGSAWLFLDILEDMVSHDRLVDVDIVVHDTLLKLRTRPMDSVMVAVTEAGDVQVILPVILAALAWFVWHRLWQTSLYLLAAVGCAEILVNVMKVALHRPRPSLYYDGAELFSFPSSHATMSVVVYGFLGFLVCREQRVSFRQAMAITAGLLASLIAFSRLYLGVHWLSDVVAGMSFGLAWVGALAMAYTYRAHEDVRPKQLSILLIATLLLSGAWHIMRDHSRDTLRYAPLPHVAANLNQVPSGKFTKRDIMFPACNRSV